MKAVTYTRALAVLNMSFLRAKKTGCEILGQKKIRNKSPIVLVAPASVSNRWLHQRVIISYNFPGK